MSGKRELKIAVCDWGTSKIAAPGGILNLPMKENYLGNDNAPLMAHYPSGTFHGILASLDQMIGNPDILGLTGLGHSLIPIARKGVDRYAMIGDEPSLTPQAGLPPHLARHYPEETTAKTSSVRKLAGLLSQPELHQVLFETDVDDRFRYTSLLSLLAWRFLGKEHGGGAYPIFPDEARDFITEQDRESQQPDVAVRFGLHPHELALHPEGSIRWNGKEVIVMQDLRAELKVIQPLFSNHSIPEDAWVMATDSVLKRIRKQPDQTTTAAEGLHYDTMREMGNTGYDHVMGIFQGLDIAHDTGLMFRFFNEVLEREPLSEDWFFDPREINRYVPGKLGQLWKRDDVGWRAVSKQEVVQEQYPIRPIVAAYGWGVAAGMYEQMPENVGNVVLYGGLMCLHGSLQQGWERVFRGMAPTQVRTHWLKMPNSRIALELVIRGSRGEQIDYSQEIPVEYLGDGGGLRQQWEAMRAEVIHHGRM